MSEFDELGRLRDADPIRGEPIPSADGPAQRALRERIVMSEHATNWWRKRTTAISAAAAAVVLLAGGIVFATRGSDAPKPGPDNDPIPPGAASCVERYSLQTLPNREVAFDGTVKSADGDSVTFTVGEWFKGGSKPEITLKGASTLGGITSAGSSVSLEPGTRLLVAGDGGFAWSCGYTQPYSSTIAADWRSALD